VSLLLLQGSEQQRKRVVLCDSLVQMLEFVIFTIEHREILVEDDIGKELDAIALHLSYLLSISSDMNLWDDTAVALFISLFQEINEDNLNPVANEIWSKATKAWSYYDTYTWGTCSINLILQDVISEIPASDLNLYDDVLNLLFNYFLVVDPSDANNYDDEINLEEGLFLGVSDVLPPFVEQDPVDMTFL